MEEGIFKKTNDCWYSNYKNNTVKLSYFGNVRRYDPRLEPIYKVAVWGNDDFGIEKEFNSENEAVGVYERLKNMEYINHDDLYKLGFSIY